MESIGLSIDISKNDFFKYIGNINTNNMGVALIYPQGDYTAAEIAHKLKALAEGRNLKIYVSNKNLREKKISPAVKFKNVTTAILIMYDTKIIDKDTDSELRYFCDKNIHTLLVVPDTFKNEYNCRSFDIHRYKEGDQDSFMREISSIKNHFKPVERKNISTSSNSSNNILWILFGLILLLLLLDMLSKSKK